MRKWTLQIEDWPALPVAFYLMKVLGVSKSKSPLGLLVELEHLGKSQAGRRHSVLLPLPCRPGSLTASFLGAAGLDVSIGTVTPADAIGAILKARMEPAPDGKGYQAVAFEPMRKEPKNEHASE